MPAPAMIMIAVPSSLICKGFLRSGDSTSCLLVKCIAIINALDAFVLASCVGTRIYLPRERLVSRSHRVLEFAMRTGPSASRPSS